MKKIKFLKKSQLILVASLFLVNCDSDKQTVTAEGSARQEVVWSWSDYPIASELLIRSMPVDIQPKQSFEIQSEGAGIISLEVNDKISNVNKDDVIARMDVDTIDEQAERLTIMEQKQVLDSMKTEELELPEQEKDAREALQEARRKMKLMEMIIKNPAMAEMSNELFGGDLGEVNDRTLQDAKSELALAERKVAWAEEFDGKLRKGQMRIQEMDLTRNKRQLEETRDRSVYQAPFDGELRLEVNYIEGKQEYTVGGRETFATLNDYTEIHAHVDVANASWINIQPQRLYLKLQDRERTMMTFEDDRVEKDPRSQREIRKYIFAVPLKGNEALKRLAGAQMTAELIHKLPEQCHIVPKYDLSLFALGKTDSLDWGVMVEKLWPGAKVLAEGRKDLAIQYHVQPNANR